MKELAKIKAKPESNLREVIQIINEGAAQIALVVDEYQKLLGVITDGDIRRALLSGKSLDSSAKDIMFQNFRALPYNATEQDAISLMRRETLHQIPALDEHGRIVRLFLLEELIKPKRLKNFVIIMAGGKGTRLGNLTQYCPKPMLLVGNKPLLQIILEQCIDAGFQHFFLSVNYLKNQIEDYFGNGNHWNVRIEYLEETKPLGTGGALSLLTSKPSEPFLVLNGDVLTKVDYNRLLNFHNEQQVEATLCVREHSTQIPYGLVEINGSSVISLEEKPLFSHYVNAGIYLVNPILLDLVPKNRFFDMPQLIEKAIQENYRISAFPIHEYWLDIGRPETLERAKEEWV